MLRRILLLGALLPLLSGCAIPYLIALAVQGSGKSVSRIEFRDSQYSELCRSALSTVNRDFESFTPLTAHYGNLSRTNPKSKDAVSSWLTTTQPDLMWLPIKAVDRNDEYCIAQGRYALSANSHHTTIVLGGNASTMPNDFRDEILGFSTENSFSFTLLIPDLPTSSDLATRLFLSSNPPLDLASPITRSSRLIRLNDLTMGSDQAKIMQLTLINERPYLLVSGETNQIDDPDLTGKLPDGYSLNWQTYLFELQPAGQLTPLCTYLVHTRNIRYASS